MEETTTLIWTANEGVSSSNDTRTFEFIRLPASVLFYSGLSVNSETGRRTVGLSGRLSEYVGDSGRNAELTDGLSDSNGPVVAHTTKWN